MEARHDWAKMVFTPELFKYVLTQMIPEIIVHSESQDEEQVRRDTERDKFFTAEEAKQYGLVDEVLTMIKRKSEVKSS